MALSALQESASCKSAGTDSRNGLEDVPARASRIDRGIQEYNQSHDLVVFEDPVSEFRTQQRDD